MVMGPFLVRIPALDAMEVNGEAPGELIIQVDDENATVTGCKMSLIIDESLACSVILPSPLC